MSHTQLKLLHEEVKGHADPQKASFLQGYFKTGQGEYGDGDIFIGLTVPQSRTIAKMFYQGLELTDLDQLIKSPIHEERLIALHILVLQYMKANEKTKKDIFDFYLSHTQWINNWDLVDTSARDIVGAYLFDKHTSVLEKLAHSTDIWERRIAMISTHYFIKHKKTEETFKIARLLLHDSHDLIHKAVGWMLREAGKHSDRKQLQEFLDEHADVMPRTMLRYAIEHFSESQRKAYLAKRRTHRTL